MTDQTPPVDPDKDTEPQPETTETQGDQTFKTFEDAIEGYRNVQGAYTKSTQENKELREEMAQIQEQMSLMQFHQPQAQAQPQPQDFDSQYIQDPEKAIESKVSQSVAEQVQQAQVATALNELQVENPAEFNERYHYAQVVSKDYPQLVTSPAGVKKLFEMGDKRRVEDMRRNAQQSINLLFGGNVDMDKLQQLVEKNPQPQTQDTNQAYMPDTTQSTGPTPGPEAGTTIAKAVQEGDIDTVIEETLRQALED